MKLIDELKEIERSHIQGNWNATLDQIAALMRHRARNRWWGFIRIGCPSRIAAGMLIAWAEAQGLSASGDDAVDIVWGMTPILRGGCDANIMPDGSLEILAKDLMPGDSKP